MTSPRDDGAASASGGVARPLSVQELLEDQDLTIPFRLGAGADGLGRVVAGTRIQKSGLALAGHFHGIESGRVQVLGVTEQSYLSELSSKARRRALRSFFGLELCCVVLTECEQARQTWRGVLDDLLACADRVSTPLLLSPERSSRTIMGLHELLDERLAPRLRVHGVLVDVFQVGLLLLGRSGVGKSEIALELIMRGHRIVADDVVDCHYRPPGMVFGAPADLLRHHLEVRGLGVLNIKDLFGVTAIRERKRVDVVVKLARSRGEEDRLGLERRYHEVLGVAIPELCITVRPGRDMASIMEVAARNKLLERAGRRPETDLFATIDDMMGQEPSGDSVPIAVPPVAGGFEPVAPRPPSETPPAPESVVELPGSRKP